jgi:hypothetical protein
MPIDDYEEDEKPGADELGKGRRFNDFDCPECSANNPWGDGFGDGDEVRCCYCGLDFKAVVSDSGKLKLKEL